MLHHLQSDWQENAVFPLGYAADATSELFYNNARRFNSPKSRGLRAINGECLTSRKITHTPIAVQVRCIAQATSNKDGVPGHRIAGGLYSRWHAQHGVMFWTTGTHLATDGRTDGRTHATRRHKGYCDLIVSYRPGDILARSRDKLSAIVKRRSTPEVQMTAWIPVEHRLMNSELSMINQQLSI